MHTTYTCANCGHNLFNNCDLLVHERDPSKPLLHQDSAAAVPIAGSPWTPKMQKAAISGENIYQLVGPEVTQDDSVSVMAAKECQKTQEDYRC